MIGNLYYKKYIEKLIDFDPTTIKINRIEKVDDGFKGFTENEISVTEIVTFYQKRSNRQFISDTGVSVGFMGTSIEKILTKFDADILAGDTFKANGKEYLVTFINPFIDICKQIEVEVIKNEL